MARKVGVIIYLGMIVVLLMAFVWVLATPRISNSFFGFISSVTFIGLIGMLMILLSDANNR